MKSLIQELQGLDNRDLYPFHMPGHKRMIEMNMNLYKMDITEIGGFDNLHHATGLLKELQDRYAKLYGSEEAYLLINGSSGGILSSIYAATKAGDHILIARNSHKSVYHGALLSHLEVSYLYPKMMENGINGGITCQQVREALNQDSKIKAVVITSPTYDGVLSPIGEIAKLVHEKGAILIVDAAHGAHFGLQDRFPENEAAKVADLCILSLHKTLPSPTQTAVLLKNGVRVDSDQVKKSLNIFETSSPSYVMMAAMEYCLSYCEPTKENQQRMVQYHEMLDHFYDRVKDLKLLQVYRNDNSKEFDRSKILMLTSRIQGYSGEMLMDTLRRDYSIECEMAAPHYVTALSSFMDHSEGFQRLADALYEIDQSLMEQVEQGVLRVNETPQWNSRLYQERYQRVSLYEAQNSPWEQVPIEEASGRVSAEFVYLYPPGIPIVTPGEEIPTYFAEEIVGLMQQNFEVNGLSDYRANTIKVLKIDTDKVILK